ncbi:hypothetical protein [Halomonas sp. WWR20]
MDMDTLGPVLMTLPLFGLMVMTVMPRDWQNLQGWLIVSFVAIPGLLLVICFPPLVFGLLFFAGVFASKRR